MKVEQRGENDWEANCPLCPEARRGFKKPVHDWADGHSAWHLVQKDKQTQQDKLDALKDTVNG
jgi:hypothetical protein